MTINNNSFDSKNYNSFFIDNKIQLYYLIHDLIKNTSEIKILQNYINNLSYCLDHTECYSVTTLDILLGLEDSTFKKVLPIENLYKKFIPLFPQAQQTLLNIFEIKPSILSDLLDFIENKKNNNKNKIFNTKDEAILLTISKFIIEFNKKNKNFNEYSKEIDSLAFKILNMIKSNNSNYFLEDLKYLQSIPKDFDYLDNYLNKDKYVIKITSLENTSCLLYNYSIDKIKSFYQYFPLKLLLSTNNSDLAKEIIEDQKDFFNTLKLSNQFIKKETETIESSLLKKIDIPEFLLKLITSQFNKNNQDINDFILYNINKNYYNLLDKDYLNSFSPISTFNYCNDIIELKDKINDLSFLLNEKLINTIYVNYFSAKKINLYDDHKLNKLFKELTFIKNNNIEVENLKIIIENKKQNFVLSFDDFKFIIFHFYGFDHLSPNKENQDIFNLVSNFDIYKVSEDILPLFIEIYHNKYNLNEEFKKQKIEVIPQKIIKTIAEKLFLDLTINKTIKKSPVSKL